MPRYRAKERVFVDNSLREPGDEFVTNSAPHPTAWELLDKPEPAKAPEPKAAEPKAAAKPAAKGAAGADGAS